MLTVKLSQFIYFWFQINALFSRRKMSIGELACTYASDVM